MGASFWIKFGLSFLVGGIWVTLSSVAAERFGSKVGGLIGGLPSTIVVTLLFIGLTQTPERAAESAVIVPLVMGVNGIFVTVFISISRRGLAPALGGALLTWFCLGCILMVLNIRALWISILGWLLLAMGCFLVIEKGMKIRSQGKKANHYTAGQIVGRATLSGTVVAFAVLMSKVAGPLAGGIFATFPAVFLSNLIISYRSGGVDFSSAVAKSLMVSGVITVPIYALLVWFFYPRVGLVTGTLFAFLLSAGAGLLTLQVMKSRLT
jgi:uncharacterized membrane protein (GlpM family)